MEIVDTKDQNETDKAIPSSAIIIDDNGRFMSSCLLVTQGIIVYAHCAVLSFLIVRVHHGIDDSTPKPQHEDHYYNEGQKVLSKCHGILFTFTAFVFTIVVQELYIRAEKESKLKAIVDLVLLVATCVLLWLITIYQVKHSMIYDHLGLFYVFISAYFAVTLLITVVFAVRLCNKMRRLDRYMAASLEY